VPSNQQRRDAERLRLQRQLESRREREAARRRTTLIVSIIGTLVIIAAIVTVIVVVNGNPNSTPPAAAGPSPSRPSPTSPSSPVATTSAPQTSSSAPVSSAPPLAAPAACTTPAKVLKGGTATFDGLTVKGATDLSKGTTVESKNSKTPKALECADLVTGKGAAASPTATVTVQYTGVLYKNGKVFDSSWSRGQSATFSLAQVVPGFTQGIGGTGKVAPMKVGGRRVMILPPSLGYGSQANGPIPADSTLVFVVDLVKIDK
jgi:cytoskeletal protein RodZ